MKHHHRATAVAAGILLVATSIAAAPPVKTVLYRHAHIYTGDPQTPWAQAMLVADQQIIAIGTDKTLARRATTVIDLQGRTVIPGIVDSHTHLLYGAYSLHGLNLSTPELNVTPDDKPAFGTRLHDYASAHPSDTVLFARADFSTTLGSMPTHGFLDALVADRPLVIHNTSEHALWVNAATLALTGLTSEAVSDADEERGIVRDASGNPTGVFLEAAMQIVDRAVNKILPVASQLEWVKEATHYLNGFGITSVVNATGSLAEIQLYAALRDRGELTLRTRTAFGSVAVQHHLTPEFLADLEQARSRYHDDWVSANLVKFFTDGATGPFPPLVYAAKDYERLVFELDARGYQLMSHAIRPDTVHMVLDTYAKLEKARGSKDRRLRIEHADYTYPGDLERFKELSVIADMQPSFCCTVAEPDNGTEISMVTDRWHSIEQPGAVLAFSSDWPCTWPPNPFVGMQQAVTRQAWKAPPGNTLPLDGGAQAGAVLTGETNTPEERVTLASALRAYTLNSAYAARTETRVGSLEVGKLADFVVLSEDPFQTPPESLGRVRAIQTVVGGKTVYQEATSRTSP